MHGAICEDERARARAAAALNFRKSKLTVERCKGLRCLLIANKERLAGRLHARAFFEPCAHGSKLVAA